MDTTDLSTLLDLWTEHFPCEVSRREGDSRSYTLSSYETGPTWESVVNVPEMELFGYPSPGYYLVFAHALACIERAGWAVEIASPTKRDKHWSSTGGRVMNGAYVPLPFRTGPTPAHSLVALRLAIAEAHKRDMAPPLRA